MKHTKNLLRSVVAFASAGVAATILIIQHRTAKEATSPAAGISSAVSPARTQAVPATVLPTAPSVAPAAAPTPRTVGVASASDTPPETLRTNSTPQKAAVPSNSGATPPKEPVKDPLAREALAFVGADPEAEAYWYVAINDPDLPASERQDLIEDLNEEGLSNPKHPRPEDLPLIYNRMLLIEEAGAYAMDQVNADAFAEAYKDLVNLADLAMGGGAPVR